MNRRPKKTHYVARKGDKFSKCGRELKTMAFPTTHKLKDVTCSTCIEPNKPFTVSPLR